MLSEANAKIDQSIETFTNSENIKVLQDKAKVLDAYLSKLRDSNSMIHSFQKQMVANFYMKSELNPVMASLRGTESLVAQMESVYGQV